MLNLSRFIRFSLGKIWFGRFDLCKRFDILQFWTWAGAIASKKLDPKKLILIKGIAFEKWLFELQPIYFIGFAGIFCRNQFDVTTILSNVQHLIKADLMQLDPRLQKHNVTNEE